MVLAAVEPEPQDAMSGQVTANSGTVTSFPDLKASRVLIRRISGASSDVYIGHTTGTLGETTGYPLTAAETLILEGLSNLNALQLVTLADGDGIAYLVLYDDDSYPIG